MALVYSTLLSVSDVAGGMTLHWPEEVGQHGHRPDEATLDLA